MGKPGFKPQCQVSTDWTPELAYAIGLIATDGCLSKDGRHIDFTSKDLQLIRLFKRCLGILHIKIGFKSSGFLERRCPRVQFGDVHFYRWLTKLGLTPKKSKTIGSLSIPRSYFFDFLRGCFDGDGTIYSFWDLRWRSSFMFYIAFTSASIPHLQWLRDTIYFLAGIHGPIKSSTRAFQLSYSKGAAKVLIQRIYYAKHLPCLDRKRIKVKKILAIDGSIV